MSISKKIKLAAQATVLSEHLKVFSIDDEESPKSQPVFHCEIAPGGGPIGLISGFKNVKELYQKIVECYDIPSDDILFCTLNTHKIDMTKLVSGHIGLHDRICAHRKGQPKEIQLVKYHLGVVLTDNGAGYTFIKKIKEGSIASKIPHIKVGDHIEKLHGQSMVGKKHYEVAIALRDIPDGTIITIRLVEPLTSRVKNSGSEETLRFKIINDREYSYIIENEAADVMKVRCQGCRERNITTKDYPVETADRATQTFETRCHFNAMEPLPVKILNGKRYLDIYTDDFRENFGYLLKRNGWLITCRDANMDRMNGVLVASWKREKLRLRSLTRSWSV